MGMFGHWWVLLAGDQNLAVATIFGLTGLDGSLWLISKPVFAAELAQVFALAMW
jgi:hypothetical protein